MESGPKQATAKWFVIFTTALVSMPVAAVALLTLTGAFQTRELKSYGDVPAFHLVERTGQKVTEASLRGKVWVAGFIFTHCVGQCPLISAQMQRVEKRLRFKERFRVVSITVDPEDDTPAVLTRYAARWDADPYKWLFLTGDRPEITSLIQRGFRLASGPAEGGSIIHSDKLVLVDGWGRIRGYYDGTDPKEVDQLLSDAKFLLKKTF